MKKHKEQISKGPSDMRNNTTLENFKSEDVTLDKFIDVKPIEVFLRFEEDISGAYRDYYKDQVVNDKRNELGRFLFGVSFTTLGLFVSIIKFSSDIGKFNSYNLVLFIISGIILISSALISLKLAIPKNQIIDPTKIELIQFHYKNTVELQRFSVLWFVLWILGLGFGLLGLFS